VLFEAVGNGWEGEWERFAGSNVELRDPIHEQVPEGHLLHGQVTIMPLRKTRVEKVLVHFGDS
jgi:hypothetical protein